MRGAGSQGCLVAMWFKEIAADAKRCESWFLASLPTIKAAPCGYFTPFRRNQAAGFTQMRHAALDSARVLGLLPFCSLSSSPSSYTSPSPPLFPSPVTTSRNLTSQQATGHTCASVASIPTRPQQNHHIPAVAGPLPERFLHFLRYPGYHIFIATQVTGATGKRHHRRRSGSPRSQRNTRGARERNDRVSTSMPAG